MVTIGAVIPEAILLIVQGIRAWQVANGVSDEQLAAAVDQAEKERLARRPEDLPEVPE